MLELDLLNKNILDNIYEGAYILDNNKIITYWNKSAERITGYTGVEVLGKCCKDNVLSHVDSREQVLCNNRCPVSKALNSGDIQEKHIYLHHKEGYDVAVSIRVIPIKNSMGSVISALQFFTDDSFHPINRI